MKLKNNLVELLSNIIHDRLQMLSVTQNDMKKTDEYKEVEKLFSNPDDIVNVDDDKLKNVLLDITDEETTSEILSNIDMIKIVLNGKNNGLDLSLDDDQEKLIKGVYDIINNYRTELEEKNNETKSYLEGFISKCQQLSSEIGTGVVRDIDTLDEIFNENGVSKEDIVNTKFEILRNNSKNYNLNLDEKVKEEVDLRILLKKANIDLDLYTDVQKNLLVSSDIENISSIVSFISENDINFDSKELLILFLFSNISILSNIYDLSKAYNYDLKDLFRIPGIFISNNTNVSSIVNDDYTDLEFMRYVDACYELFTDNISLLEANNRSVSDCLNNNLLSLIVPELSKNINILSDLSISNKEFSCIVINPFLATSISSFEECGLSDYIKANPLRLTTSYYRLKNIASNIIHARKNGQVIFRSLSDKKNYWLSKNITRKDSEVR